jgi:hypothetical protein
MAANPPEPGSAGSSTPAAPAAPDASATPAPGTAAVPATATGAAAPATPRPATPAPKPAAPNSGNNGSLVLLSLLAVLIALGASAVAVYSLDQARQATSRANEAYDTAKRAAATPTKAPAAAPGPTTAKPTPTASKGPTFVSELVRAPLKLPAAASACASVYVDIDKMTVGDSNGHEFYASNCVGPLSLHVDRTGGAVPTTINPTPELCASQITNDTTHTELIMPVITGLSFCLLTNKADAAQQSLPQRLAIVEVTDVGADNSIQLVISTWRVPAP